MFTVRYPCSWKLLEKRSSFFSFSFTNITAHTGTIAEFRTFTKLSTDPTEPAVLLKVSVHTHMAPVKTIEQYTNLVLLQYGLIKVEHKFM